MDSIFAQLNAKAWDKTIAEAEESTHCQFVVAVIKRSDTYPEIPWKAFALGTALAGLATVLLDWLLFNWISQISGYLAAVIILSGGIVSASLTILIPSFARLFLSKHRARAEVRQYAQGLFLDRELFATSQRTGVLLLISFFERRVIILPDTGLLNHLHRKAIQEIIAEMKPALKKNDINAAIETGLNSLTHLLAASQSQRAAKSDKNDLANDLIVEKGL